MVEGMEDLNDGCIEGGLAGCMDVMMNDRLD